MSEHVRVTQGAFTPTERTVEVRTAPQSARKNAGAPGRSGRGRRPVRVVPVTDLVDPVAASLAAYGPNVTAYEARNRHKVASEVERFIRSLPPHATVLDAGCGPGRDLARFRSAGLNAVGVDAVPEMVAHARQHGPCILGDLRHLGFSNATFDGVWACASLVHLPDWDTATALAGFRRVLRPGGRLYVSVKGPTEGGWRTTDIGTRWFNGWQPDRLGAVVEQAGFRIDEVATESVFVDAWAVAA